MRDRAGQTWTSKKTGRTWHVKESKPHEVHDDVTCHDVIMLDQGDTEGAVILGDAGRRVGINETEPWEGREDLRRLA